MADRPEVVIHYQPAALATRKDPGSEFGSCHTHGLEEGYGHPELVLRCFSASKSKDLVDAIVDRILAPGDRLEVGTTYEGFLSVPIGFQEIQVDGRRCLEMQVYSEGNEDWVDADVVGQEIGKLDGLDSLCQISEGGVSSGIVVSHWGCAAPLPGGPI